MAPAVLIHHGGIAAGSAAQLARSFSLYLQWARAPISRLLPGDVTARLKAVLAEVDLMYAPAAAAAVAAQHSTPWS